MHLEIGPRRFRERAHTVTGPHGLVDHFLEHLKLAASRSVVVLHPERRSVAVEHEVDAVLKAIDHSLQLEQVGWVVAAVESP
jgi:hypothetical protein